MRNNFLLILEIVWIIAGSLSAILAIKLALTGSHENIIIFASMAVVAFIFARIRHIQRKKN